MKPTKLLMCTNFPNPTPWEVVEEYSPLKKIDFIIESVIKGEDDEYQISRSRDGNKVIIHFYEYSYKIERGTVADVAAS